ncbi:MAG TPA: hypothetical protein VJ253_05615, partial [Dehalococcoidia bacterium]|nr:hypothetical protein [Dehalococcoidia bacterium]
LIFLEGLAGDESALEQYRHLTNLWESALTAVLRRYAEKGGLPGLTPEALARQVIYLILMAFEDTLMGRHVPPQAAPEERRRALVAFAEQALRQLAPRPARG